MLSKTYKFGDSLFLRLPKSFVDDNKLTEGSIVRLRTEGQLIKIKVTSGPVYKIQDLMDEIPGDLLMVEGFSDISESEFIDLVGTVESVGPDLDPEASKNSNDILKKL